LGVTEITLRADPGKLDVVADKVVAIVSKLGGSATKGVPDAGRVSILVDLPSNRESEFRGAVAAIGGNTPGSTPPATATSQATVSRETMPPATERKSFVVQIVEPTAR